jgi:uncharacterized protein (UPF0147 family)
MVEKKVLEVIELIDTVAEDTSVPKNIRRALAEAKDRLRGSDELPTRVSAAVYSMEAVSEDINMPMHARTQIWTILSALESIKTG